MTQEVIEEERAVVSLFSPGGTYAIEGEFAGIDSFEVVAPLVVIAEANVSPFATTADQS